MFLTRGIFVSYTCRMKKKLTENQQDLLIALQKGVRLHFMPYQGRFNPNAYFFRSDTMSRCTKAADGLINRGFVVNQKKNHYDKDDFVLTELGKSWRAQAQEALKA